ncbi:hypothetical protein PsorP6_003147 [Peronosclerospora sorghi]|uniref:Uncharacterized protein n=1 Tax=Peronosclerospora sorghi TaxID=230839 RepID=A0ACC0VIZ9_9STRA|nr:hypothetical protein PsorP6_003147 [Peronosclerospora sorghi]
MEAGSNTHRAERGATVLSRQALQQVNAKLQRDVAELSSMLLTRDLELARLRERCHVLTTAVEEQEAVLIDMYGTKGGTRRTAGGGRHWVQSQREYLATPRDKVNETVSTEGTQDVGKVEVDPMPCGPTTWHPRSLRASVSSSSSSSATASSSSSLLEDVGEGPQSPPPRTTIARLKQLPSLERQDSSSPSHDPFASSACFLRKSSRRRLSVSDLGLLSDHEDVPRRGDESPEAIHAEQETSHGSIELASSRQRPPTLFAEVDDKAVIKTRAQDSNKIDPGSLTFGEFLHQISLPASRDLLDKIRLFVGSILGPRGDGRPPRSTDYVEYTFYGLRDFRRRCKHFFNSMEHSLLHHPAWVDASETKLAKARDGIEKYVMDKVADLALTQLPECRDWVQQDEALRGRMERLSFITPAMLDIKPCICNEVVWSMATDELRRINSCRSPGDKMQCIVRCCSLLFSVLNLSRRDASTRPGADDFLPVFIYIVLHSQIPRLYSNCEYIAAYRNPCDLMAKAGYCFATLRSAIEFIMVVDDSMLSISKDEFQRWEIVAHPNGIKAESLPEVLDTANVGGTSHDCKGCNMRQRFFSHLADKTLRQKSLLPWIW